MILFGSMSGQMILSIPQLRYLPYFRSVFNKENNILQIMNDYYDSQINKRIEEIKKDSLPSTPNDFLDAYFIEVEKYKNEYGKDLPDYIRLLFIFYLV